MPVYEFVCLRCQHPFEELVLGGERPQCPRCGAAELEKQMSSFGVSHGSAPAGLGMQGPGSCGTCGDPRGPGACSMD